MYNMLKDITIANHTHLQITGGNAINIYIKSNKGEVCEWSRTNRVREHIDLSFRIIQAKSLQQNAADDLLHLNVYVSPPYFKMLN
jgi:hypothetical protein